MVSIPPRRLRGGSTIGCLFSLLIFGAAVYYSVNIGPVWFRYYQLVDEMKTSARLAPNLTDAVIRRRLAAKVDELHLPDSANKFTITRTGKPRSITIETQYSETVDLPLFHHVFVLKPRTEEVL